MRLQSIGRLFVIKTRLEAWAVIYAIALGAISRGTSYLTQYPGASGWILFVASTAIVFMAGGFILDHIPPNQTKRKKAKQEVAEG